MIDMAHPGRDAIRMRRVWLQTLDWQRVTRLQILFAVKSLSFVRSRMDMRRP